jgi:hypothetical protein
MIVSISGWIAINKAYMDVDPVSAVARFLTSVSGSWVGIRTRISDPGAFQKYFDDARAGIRGQLPLPATDGTVDLYPFDLAAVFAAGQKWSPRPVFQSHAAYTPALAERNRDHLRGTAAPDRIYFSLPILDARYPSLDDGLSWPELIGRYRISGYFDRYVVLEKRTRPINVDVGAVVLDERASFGKQISLPTTGALMWAKIDITPSLIGQVISVLYKLPPLYLSVKYDNGLTERFRFIPGEGRSGFLFSPTVRSAVDFMVMQSARRDDFFWGRTPVSFVIADDDSSQLKSKYVWTPTYSLTLSELRFEPDQNVALLLKRAVSIPGSVMKGGDCSIDAINETIVQHPSVELVHGIFSVRGWGVVSGSRGKANDQAFLALRSRDSSGVMVEATKGLRADVNLYFKHPDMGNVGFEVVIDAKALRGKYMLSVVQRSEDKYLECEGHLTIETSQ